jgi:hypothetical protein
VGAGDWLLMETDRTWLTAPRRIDGSICVVRSESKDVPGLLLKPLRYDSDADGEFATDLVVGESVPTARLAAAYPSALRRYYRKVETRKRANQQVKQPEQPRVEQPKDRPEEQPSEPPQVSPVVGARRISVDRIVGFCVKVERMY